MGHVLRYGCAVASLVLASSASALTAADRCESGKLTAAGKYELCRLKAESKAVRKNASPDYSKCDEKYSTKWAVYEGGDCPSIGDEAAIQSFITQHTDDVAAALAGGPLPSAGGVPKTGQTTAYGTGSDGDLQKGAARSFTDNGDGTITDNLTGLMWEKKSDDGSIHDKDNGYSWCNDTSPADGTCDTAGNPMDGTMVTTFLAALNGGGGFAGHTDWRIPNRFELESLINLQNLSPATYSAFHTSCAASCTVMTCSCTLVNGYYSSTTYNDLYAWYVSFDGGYVDAGVKGGPGYVRAVRGGA